MPRRFYQQRGILLLGLVTLVDIGGLLLIALLKELNQTAIISAVINFLVETKKPTVTALTVSFAFIKELLTY